MCGEVSGGRAGDETDEVLPALPALPVMWGREAVACRGACPSTMARKCKRPLHLSYHTRVPGSGPVVSTFGTRTRARGIAEAALDRGAELRAQGCNSRVY